MYRLAKYSDAAIGIVRIITGLFLLYHGFEIFKPEVMAEYPKMSALSGNAGSIIAYIGKALELIVGILLVVGYQTRLAALLMIVVFLSITFFIGSGKFWYTDQHPFLFVLLGVIFLFYGSGKFSLDGLNLNKSKPPQYSNF